MGQKNSARPTLVAWLEKYSAIEKEFLDTIAKDGIELAKYGEANCRIRELRTYLYKHGARFMNGGSSISTGFLSSACVACVGDCGSRTFYINLGCNRNCYFCFNPNQADYQEHCMHDTLWREELREFAYSGQTVTHIGLTGGEPLLYKEKTLAFFAFAHELCPEAHLRLYTSGAGIDERFCRVAASCGLTEIRFSIKLDEGKDAVKEVLDSIKMTCRFIPSVMVEMPVAPNETDQMKQLLLTLDNYGVCGINLLEFCYPYRNWNEFASRGFQIKNPPFDILYNYEYAGGLPIAGSEEACLELLIFALDNKLSLGVHYCSLENKNRDQILQKNLAVILDSALYELGPDCFYRTAKVFDEDIDTVQAYLKTHEKPFGVEDDCLIFHPSYIDEVTALGAIPAVSWNVIECDKNEIYIRELKLDICCNEDIS